MTPLQQDALAILAAQQAEDAFAQYGLHIDTDMFNALCDYMAELARRLIEDGPDATYPPTIIRPEEDETW